MRKSNAEVWNHFDKILDGDKNAICKHCNKIFCYKSTITNLKTHLKSMHPSAFANLIHSRHASAEQTCDREIKEQWTSRETDIDNEQSESESSQITEYLIVGNRKRKHNQDPLYTTNKQINNKHQLIEERSSTVGRSEQNECDLYGQLLAEKLKRMDEEHRLIVMNGIDNLVFKHQVKLRSGLLNQSADSAVYAPTHQNYVSESGTNKKEKLKKMAKNIALKLKDSQKFSDLSTDED